jgi:hypothetical protein
VTPVDKETSGKEQVAGDTCRVPPASSIGLSKMKTNHSPARLYGIIFGPFLSWCALDAGVPARVQTPEQAQKLDPLALQWPRFFATNGYEFAVYQPQISKWPGNQLEGRFAIAVRPAGTTNETYGVAFFTTRTEIDKFSRLVTLEDFQITKMNFPTARTKEKTYEAIIQSELPRAAKIIPLDHLEATFAVSAEVEKSKNQKVDNTPPRRRFPALMPKHA